MSGMQLVTVAGRDALQELERLRAERAKTGLHPILFGDRDDFERIQEELEEAAADATMILADSRRIDAREWFQAQVKAQPETFQAEDGQWPEAAEEEMGIVTHLELLSGEPKREVLIGLLRVTAPWEAFAQLGWGGWNSCPFPAEHCAVHRYWAEKYGAEVVSVTGDIVQCIVARPPLERPVSWELAREQYAYCHDIVDQGTETIGVLAAGLLDSPYWYFWWD